MEEGDRLEPLETEPATRGETDGLGDPGPPPEPTLATDGAAPAPGETEEALGDVSAAVGAGAAEEAPRPAAASSGGGGSGGRGPCAPPAGATAVSCGGERSAAEEDAAADEAPNFAKGDGPDG